MRRRVPIDKKCRMASCRNLATKFFWGHGICEDCWEANKDKPMDLVLTALGDSHAGSAIFTATPWKNRPVRKSPPMTMAACYESARVSAKVENLPYEIWRKQDSLSPWVHVETIKPGSF